MPHPEPLQIALSHLQSLSKEQYLYMLGIRKPIPLLTIANERGFVYLTQKDDKEIWHSVITQNSEVVLEELLDV